MKRIFLCASGLAVLILIGFQDFKDKAVISVRNETLKTYEYFDADPIPILTRTNMWGGGRRIYPYHFFNGYAHTGIMREWMVVRMENPYIEVAVLPEVGGKVWGAREKSSGQEFIYTNHVMKFREVALRGPWTSGGIEFNFGVIGHAPSTAAPVDHIIRDNPDGSVSCFVGSMDLPSRTRWSVEIILPPDKAYFITQAFWFNASPLFQSYYAWMNGAVRVDADLQMIFPGEFHIGHNYSVPLKSWPVDEQGRDLSWYKNNDFGSYKSYFTVGQFEGFYGGYWHDSDFGFGHWAHYGDVPGRKIWLWGLSRQGMIWEDLLTDDDGQYSEPQAGRLLNQSDHEFLLPNAAERWKEYWFPYKEIGPMVKAAPYAVLHAACEKKWIKIGICALQDIQEKLLVYADEKEIYSEMLDLAPMGIYKNKIKNREKNKIIRIKIGDKLDYTNDPDAAEIKRPLHFQDYDESTTEGLFMAAERADKERNYVKALDRYLDVLELEPVHVRALCRAAELYYKKGEYSTALEFAAKALRQSMYDPEANYIYGLISRRLENKVDALETLGWASRSLKFRSAAFVQMAEIYLGEKKFDLALEYARRALDYNQYNISALQAMVVTFRLLGNAGAAREVLDRLEAIDPLNHFIRYELYLLSPDPKKLKHFQSMIQNEFPHETYLEMAIYYESIKCRKEAMELLLLFPEQPTVCYWTAYLLRHSSPEESREWLEKAESLSPSLVFPFRLETMPVFQWAANSYPERWQPKYYLGLIYWSKGRDAEALDLFKACGRPEFVPLYLIRAHLMRKHDSSEALDNLEAAVQLDEKNWRARHALTDFYLVEGDEKNALFSATKAQQVLPQSTVIQIDLIKAYMMNEKYEEASAFLDELDVLPHEGAEDVHALFEACQLKLAFNEIKKGDYATAILFLEKSKTYPEKLGSGEPFFPDHRKQNYLIALCYERLGESNKALRIKREIYEYTQKYGPEYGVDDYFGGLILQEFGEKDKAEKLFKKGKPEKELDEIIVLLKK
ncbi:MAG: DUF5107 domain-containing protein [Candidatus Aminicenantes bacterium]|nr:DUF5107 domain-containing protein [Candidatus Aminicenantes bacterium]